MPRGRPRRPVCRSRAPAPGGARSCRGSPPVAHGRIHHFYFRIHGFKYKNHHCYTNNLPIASRCTRTGTQNRPKSVTKQSQNSRKNSRKTEKIRLFTKRNRARSRVLNTEIIIFNTEFIILNAKLIIFKQTIELLGSSTWMTSL